MIILFTKFNCNIVPLPERPAFEIQRVGAEFEIPGDFGWLLSASHGESRACGRIAVESGYGNSVGMIEVRLESGPVNR